MHIAFLSPEYPHELSTPSGGLGTSIKNMAEALREKGEKISIIVYGQEKEQVFKDKEIDFYFIEQVHYPFGGWYFYRKFLEKRIKEIISQNGIDILESPDWTGITAIMKFQVPHLIRLNGSDAYFCALECRRQKYKNRLFEKNALKNADAILSVSDFTGKKTMQVFDLDRGYTVIPNSIKIDDFQPSQFEPEPDRILYFGSLIRKKGILELAEIFNHVVEKNKHAQLIVAGRDVEDLVENKSTFDLFKGKLSKKAVSQIQYLGTLEYSRVREELEKASVVVLPSFAEALPMTWIEAMAMEKALVTSNIGWAPEVMLDGRTGYTVDPKDHGLFANRILKLLEDRELAKRMGQEARKRVVEKFSSAVVAEQNLSFYQNLIDKQN